MGDESVPIPCEGGWANKRSKVDGTLIPEAQEFITAEGMHEEEYGQKQWSAGPSIHGENGQEQVAEEAVKINDLPSTLNPNAEEFVPQGPDDTPQVAESEEEGAPCDEGPPGRSYFDLEDEETVDIECINATNMNYNDGAVAKRKAAIIFIQEHKLKGKALGETRKRLKEANWTWMCGPCDENTKKPNAGVGVMIDDNQNCKIIDAKVHTEDLRKHAKQEEQPYMRWTWDGKVTCLSLRSMEWPGAARQHEPPRKQS